MTKLTKTLVILLGLFCSLFPNANSQEHPPHGDTSKSNRIVDNVEATVTRSVLTMPKDLNFDILTGMNTQIDSKGTEFWICFQENYDNSKYPLSFTLFITSDVNTQVTIHIPTINWQKQYSVLAHQITTVQIPSPLSVVVNGEGKTNKGIHIFANDEITVYGLNQMQASTDAYLALPLDILNVFYMIMSYPSISNDYNQSQFAIVSPYDNVSVTITPASNTEGGRTAGQPFTITLNEGQVYQVQAPDNKDLTGSIIQSSLPVAVFSGHSCANIPIGYGYCDHLVEQIPPVNTWGSSFLTVPLSGRENGDTFRFLSSQDGTNLKINGQTVATLNFGDYYETILTKSAQITASNPILVMQYSNGDSYDPYVDNNGDPFMMLIPPTEQFLNLYSFSTPSSNFPTNYMSITIQSDEVTSLMLDGNPISSSLFKVIGNTGYSGAAIPVEVGPHSIESVNSVPFGIYSYGFWFCDSYGYAGGLSLEYIYEGSAPIITRTNETIQLSNQAQVEGQTINISAKITDPEYPYTKSATLYYHHSSQQTFKTVQMVKGYNNIWSASIPSYEVQSPGLFYYLYSTDGQLSSTSPTINAQNNPYSIAVLPNEPPSISHTSVTSSNLSTQIKINATISDQTLSLASRKLYYRIPGGNPVYIQTNMNHVSGNVYEGIIPASFVTEKGVEYYIQATDNYGVSSYHGYPDDPHFIIIQDPYIKTPTPILLSPANQLTNVDLMPKLEWHSVEGATHWIQLADNTRFASPVINVTGVKSKYMNIPAWLLQTSTRYYWRVLARKDGIPSNWPNYFYFVTADEIDTNRLFISNLLPSTYEAVYMEKGEPCYVDRDYLLDFLPDDLKNLLWIRTANDDKKSTVTQLITFNLLKKAKIYILYDVRTVTRPNWLTSQFTQTNYEVKCTDMSLDHFEVWKKEFEPGIVKFGGNLSDGASGALINYLVLLEPVLIPPPVADFDANPKSGKKPLTVQFLDKSEGEITQWDWNFGDGNTSSLQNPVHTFNDIGKYNITLMVTGPGGTNSIKKNEYIDVYEAPPIADFTADKTSGNKPLTVKFTDTSTGIITSRYWNFGDGSTSEEQNPIHTYQSTGTFTVSLSVEGPGGSDTEEKKDYITVTEQAPEAEFSADKTNGKAPLTVKFTDSSTGEITQWLWDFGDGGTSTQQNPEHIYNTVGQFTVSLTVTGSGGSDTETKVDYITVTESAPAANFGAEPTTGERPLTVQFADSSTGLVTSRLWDFGDGNGSTGQNPLHTFDETGSYTVTLTVVGPGGTDSKTREDYIKVKEPAPVANFGVEPHTGTKPLTVQFADSSTGLITSRLWDFDDGNGSTEQNPVHTYEVADSFTVSLTVAGPGGVNTKTIENCVCVTEPTGISGLYDAAIPDKFQLYQNYPNPFNPSTTIQFGLPKAVHVELSIYNLFGQVIDKLVLQSLAPGSYRYTWEAAKFPSGVYFYKINAGEFVDIKKMIFMK
ncbi:PKD domain-containing protein [candidate division KSB1 bacterium]|nr:PKD domain-containing protein [candidate division KSB1 bacterium]